MSAISNRWTIACNEQNVGDAVVSINIETDVVEVLEKENFETKRRYKMVMNLKRIVAALVLSLSAVYMAGCEGQAQIGSALGALAGAGIGQLAGGDTEATLIGAAVGAGAGYMLGNETDKKVAVAERDAIRADQNSTVVWITNSNGSQVPVRLAKNGPAYIGPRGETYPRLPNQDQLRPVYGF
ncbi:MAG: glycine zipper domain-containing protein [Planctomycetota bacterium]